MVAGPQSNIIFLPPTSTMYEEPNRSLLGLGPPEDKTCNFANIFPQLVITSPIVQSSLIPNSNAISGIIGFYSAKFSVLLLWVNQIKGVLSEIQGFS